MMTMNFQVEVILGIHFYDETEKLKTTTVRVRSRSRPTFLSRFTCGLFQSEEFIPGRKDFPS